MNQDTSKERALLEEFLRVRAQEPGIDCLCSVKACHTTFQLFDTTLLQHLSFW